MQGRHAYTYDGLNRMTSGDAGAYALDASGNRAMPEYDLEGAGAALHQYSSTPRGVGL